MPTKPSGSGVEMLKLVRQFKTLDAKREQGLSAAEEKQYKELCDKLSHKLDPESYDKSPKRNALRVNTRQEIRLGSGKDFKNVYMHNISGGGLYLASKENLPVGSTIKMNLFFKEENYHVELEGKITWTNPKGVNHLPPGMGVQFKNLSSDQEKFIRRLIHGVLDKSILADEGKK